MPKIITMKKYIKLAIRILILATAFIVATILTWETFRPNVVSLFEGEPVETPTEEPSDFELYVASKEVQEELELMYKRHQRDQLTQEITELETLKQ